MNHETVPLPDHGKPKFKPLEGESERLRLGGVASFHDEHRKTVDGRKDHLARMGMIPQHVAALRMPDLDERPLRLDGHDVPIPNMAPPAPLLAATVHDEARDLDAEEMTVAEIPEEYAPRKLPQHLEEVL